MKLHERVKEIEKLETVDTPWSVNRIFGSMVLFGAQVGVKGREDSDYVDLQEFKTALEWLVDQCGGTITWTKSSKKEQKKC